MDPAIQPAVRKKLEADHNCSPVFLTQEVRRLLILIGESNVRNAMLDWLQGVSATVMFPPFTVSV